MIRHTLLSLALCLLPAGLLPLTAVAQEAAPADSAQTEEDRGWITGLIEDNLSGAGRQVRLVGFQGALSSRATFEELSIADDEGVWITLRDGAMQWNRAALLAGRIQIAELTAAEIDLPRTPAAEEDALPEAEASGFALPDLPVAVEIGTIRADRVSIGAPVFGTAVAFSLSGSARLAGGEGETDLSVTRLDGAAGELTFIGSYDNDSRTARLDLMLSEGPDGIAAGLLDVPGTPSLTLAVSGAGPLDDFDAEIALTTDGQPRLQGTVELLATVPEGAAEGTAPVRSFRTALAGDVAPLFLPEYQDFFGDRISLDLAGTRTAAGELSLSDLTLQSRALTLTGQVRTDADGLPVLVDLRGQLGLPDGGPVLLPMTGAETRVGSADLTVSFDAATGPDWRVAGQVLGLDRPDLDIAELRLDGTGQLQRADTASLNGQVVLAAEGLSPADPALAQALGPEITASAGIDWQQGGSVTIRDLDLSGADYGLTGDAVISGLDSAFTVDGQAVARLSDLSRLSGLAGRPLSGAAEARVDGEYGILSGIFDAELAVDGTDLSAGIAELDRLLAGQLQVALSARRDETGTTLRNLTLDAQTLTGNLQGTVRTGASDLTAVLDFADLSVLGPDYGGQLSVEAALQEAGTLRRFNVSGTGEGLDVGIPELDGLLSGTTQLTLTGTEQDGAVVLDVARLGNTALTLDASGRYQAGNSDLTARLDFPDVGALGRGYGGSLTAEARLTEEGALRRLDLTGSGQDLSLAQAELDRILAGRTDISLAATMEGEAIRIERLDLTNPQLTATASGGQAADGGRAITLDARLANLALLVPGFPGPLTVEGTAEELADGGYRLDLAGRGPGGTDATVRGTVAAGFGTADLAIAGSAQLGLVNPFIAPQAAEGPLQFDLRLNGAPGLSALSGQVRTSGARVTAPTAGIALEEIAATIGLGGGRAQIDMQGRFSEGGRIALSGPVALSGGYDGALDLTLTRAHLRDPELYDTRVSGDLSIDGPLTGGATISGSLTLDETEIRVPSTGLGGASTLTDLNHVGEPADVRRTRVRAGLLDQDGGSGGGGGGRPYGLDVRVLAPNQIFVRGRGLDAELGGQLLVRGDTNNVQPQGQFELVRGRLDILGQRFTLDEGLFQLQGNLDPYIRFSASTETEDDTATIVIEGFASEPEIRFVSSAGLPEEEVLSRLLFGRGLDNLTAFQAAQLAAAVATLAGQGGEGIIGRLRQDFGLDDFDVTTDDEGNAALRAGKYLTDRVYTDITLGGAGESSINLNLDVTRNVTVRGQVGSEGGGGLGIFYQRDY